MRQNLTKKEIINSIYMQLGYSKKLIENILEDMFEIILESLKEKGKVKICSTWWIGGHPNKRNNQQILEHTGFLIVFLFEAD